MRSEMRNWKPLGRILDGGHVVAVGFEGGPDLGESISSRRSRAGVIRRGCPLPDSNESGGGIAFVSFEVVKAHLRSAVDAS